MRRSSIRGHSRGTIAASSTPGTEARGNFVSNKKPGRQEPSGLDRIRALACALHRGVRSPERNGARQRPRTRADRVAVIAALHDPLSILAADDLADVMTPDHDGADLRAARVRSIMSPRAREVEGRAGVAADLAPHIPPAPCAGTTARTGVMVTTGMMMTGCMVVMMMARPSLCARSKQAKRCRDSHDSTQH